MKRPWIKAAVTSLALSAVVTLAATIIFGGGIKYTPSVEWDLVGRMTYDEATKFLAERSERLSGWEAFLGAWRYQRFWLDMAAAWLLLSAVAFPTCMMFLWWLRRGDTPSNSSSSGRAEARRST